MDNSSASRIDVVVVGAGPAGTAAAIALARAGRSVTLIDKAVFPRDKCCGDGLTTGALRRLEALGVRPETISSWTWVDDVQITPPSGRRRTFPLPHGQGHFAAVATRFDLDNALVGLTRAAGAEVLEGHTLTAAAQHAGEVRLTIDRPNGPDGSNGGDGRLQLAAAHVIAADGMWSPTRKLLDVTSPSDPVTPYLGEWHGYRQYVSNVHTEASRALWVWFDREILPGYLWCFPSTNGTVNLGFGVERRPGFKTSEMKGLWASLLTRPYLREVLGSEPTFGESPKAWPIPCAPTNAALTDGRVLFVGDAARACDVLTGEGIGQALQTGTMAADAIMGAHTFSEAEIGRASCRERV